MPNRTILWSWGELSLSSARIGLSCCNGQVQPQDDHPTQEMRAVEPESGINTATVLVAVGVSAVVAVLIVTSGLVLILVLQTR